MVADFTVHDVAGYCLLDSGDGDKLEEIAGYRVIRPCVQAVWPRRLTDAAWQQAAARCERTKNGAGRWQFRRQPPHDLALVWTAGSAPAVRFLLRLNGFGNFGVFFEQ